MTDRVMIIGESPAAVAAVAMGKGISINPAEIKEFSSLTTTYSPDSPKSGSVELDCKGYVVVGDMQD